MLFNSWTFVIFIIPVLSAYYLLSFRWQNRMLLVASCIFYASWDWRFLILLAGTTSIDYFVALQIRASGKQSTKLRLVIFSCVMNLVILGFFKYFNFFSESLRELLFRIGIETSSRVIEVALPVGISFYTFHAMSYAIDVYREKLDPIKSFSDYMLFVLYFPQLVAGPIARAALLIPQITHPRTVKYDNIVAGLWLCLFGLFKKMVIADNLGSIADSAFKMNENTPSGSVCLLGVYAFAFQIYCDFSGYSDIARGLAKLMGIELTLNFQLPYFAMSPSDLWHRWHISLSTWLRDYLYIPLGGNRNGTFNSYKNLMITMILGGLWHGAAWNFVIWGIYHGMLLVVERLWQAIRIKFGITTFHSWTRIPKILCMFQLTCLGWLFFRAESFHQIVMFLQQIFFHFDFNLQAAKMIFPIVFFPGILIGLEIWLKNADDPRKRPGWNYALGPITVSLLLISIVYLSPGNGRQFLYFQF